MQSRIVMMIHEALWLEAPEAEAKETEGVMEETMTTTALLTFPLELDFS